MLQLPQIQALQAAPAGVAKTDPTAAPGEGGEFAEFLDALTDGSLPADLKAELVQQVQDGVPVSEVLAELVQHLREDPELGLAPAMAPLVQALAPQVELPREVIQAQLAARRGSPVASTPVHGQEDSGEAAKLDLAAELESGELPQGDQLVGKHKALLAGRVAALESVAPATTAPSATQAAALRVLDTPTPVPTPLGQAAPVQDGDSRLPQQLLVAPRVGDPQWGQALAQRVLWMVGQEKQTAELRLNPAHLGPVEVKLTLQHDQASVSLLASNAAVREALEQALPRLRDMLGQQDIQLAQVDVGQRQAHADGRAAGGPGGEGGRHGASDANGNQDAQTADAEQPGQKVQTVGLLDAYA